MPAFESGPRIPVNPEATIKVPTLESLEGVAAPESARSLRDAVFKKVADIVRNPVGDLEKMPTYGEDARSKMPEVPLVTGGPQESSRTIDKSIRDITDWDAVKRLLEARHEASGPSFPNMRISDEPQVSIEPRQMTPGTPERPRFDVPRMRSEIPAPEIPNAAEKRFITPSYPPDLKNGITPETPITRAMFGEFMGFIRNEVVFFHGTSGALLESIKQNGLGREHSPVAKHNWDLFSRAYEEVVGTLPGLSKDRTEARVFTSGNIQRAWHYAERAAGEGVDIMLREIPGLIDSGKLSPEVRGNLLAIQEELQKLKESHSPLLLKLSGRVLDHAAESAQDILNTVFEWGENISVIKGEAVPAKDFIKLIQNYFDMELAVSGVPREAILGAEFTKPK